MQEGKPPTGRETPRSSISPSSSDTSPLSRKRYAPMDRDEAHHEALAEHLRINTASSVGSEGSQDHMCICQPAPKIPRPRNAFILYRQHHQAQVTVENPKLSNPEISKIIGQKWKDEVEDVKENWKRLADEEKERHQIQYPDYRYQPRRGGRGSSNKAGPSPTDAGDRCPRCNGRLMNTPRTPQNPFLAPISSSNSSRMDIDRQGPSPLRRQNIDVARRHSIDQFPPGRMPFPGQLPPVRSIDESDPMSPEMKRRRANVEGQYHSVSPANEYAGYGRHPAEIARGPPEPGHPYAQPRSYARSPLPDPGAPIRQLGAPMPPPPRPPVLGSWGDQGMGRRNTTYDESVRLPPLQTAMPPASMRAPLRDSGLVQVQSSGLGRTPPPATQTQDLEAQIMSAPFRQKLNVLAKVCMPVPVLGPEIRSRGAFVAVEGSNPAMTAAVGRAVERGITTLGDVAMQTWSNEVVKEEGSGDKGEDTEGSSSSADEPFATSYLRTIMQWQEKSRQIAAHVTTRPPDSMASEAEEGSTGSDAGETSSSTSPKTRRTTAVALVKDGYSLTLSDQAACRTRIDDLYRPIDHWQWMASLWRGTVCPDLVVYAKPMEDDDEEVLRYGKVEFSKDMGLMVVRGSWRNDKDAGGNGGEIEEATERRLIFEIGEWMREGSFRERKPRNWREG